jgi:hypothetical protein
MALRPRSSIGPLTWATLLVLIAMASLGTAGFLKTPLEKLPLDTVPRTTPAPWVLPAGRVAILVPEGSHVPAAWPYARPIPEWRLRESGFVVVHTPRELDQAVQDGAIVIWVHREAVPLVDPAWLRARHLEGHPVGVIDGTMTELRAWFGIGPGAGGWLRPRNPLPIFALFDGRACRLGPDGLVIEPPNPQRFQPGGTSEHFSLDLVISASLRAVTFCT